MVPFQLLAAWGIDTYVSAVPPLSGTMNETWLVDIGRGRRVVLRRHRRIERTWVEYEHGVMAAARAGGVPCPEILPTVEGAPIVEAAGRFYSLHSWAPGVQLHGVTPKQATRAGATLALVHRTLRDHHRGPWKDDPAYDPVAVDARLGRMAEAAGDQDGLADEMRARRRWLALHADEPPVPPGRLQVIHGDYQLTNLFFEGDALSCVIDWDKARPEWPAWEVVRTLDYAIGLDPARGTAFIDGYRSVLPLPPGELYDAARRWGHHTAHEIWVYEEVYLRGKDRAASFIDKKPWLPFIERWERSGLA